MIMESQNSFIPNGNICNIGSPALAPDRPDWLGPRHVTITWFLPMGQIHTKPIGPKS